MKIKSKHQELINELMDKADLSDQIESNQHTLILLIHSPRFQTQVQKIRSDFKIPPKRGFRANTKKLRRWVKTLDRQAWDKALYSILIEFPRINENFIEHIGLYIKFNGVYYAPILNMKLSYPHLSGKNRDQLCVEIYDKPDGKEWERIKKAVNDHFRRRGVEHKEPIKKFDLKLRAWARNPNLISDIIDEAGVKAKDEELADKLINLKADRLKEKTSINLIRQYRKRLKEDIEERLG